MDWVRNHKPLVHAEMTFMKHKDDFVALSGDQECGWLDGVVEDTLYWLLPSTIMRVSYRCCPFLRPGRRDRTFLTVLQSLFTSSEQVQKTDHRNLQLYSKRRVDVVVRLVLVLTTVALLVGPSAVLYFVAGQSALKICLIMVFTLLFAAALSVCTKAKRHEMLAATAT